MPARKQAGLDAGLITRKGEAKPAAQASAPGSTVAVTVRLDPERYKRLITYGAQFAPRRKNQDIFVEALDAYLARVEVES